MIRSIFIKPEDSTAFARHGFVRKPLLSAQQVGALASLYEQHFPKGTEQFFSSTFLQDVALKEMISNQLCDILLPAIAPYIENYKVLGAQFLVKNSGEGGEMPYH